MTFKRVITLEGKRKQAKKRLLECECDQCKKIFTRTFYKKRCDNRLTFCSSTCLTKSKQAGGKIQQKYQIHMEKKYGVKNPFQADEIKEKRKKTYIKRYGVDNPGKIQSLWKESHRKKHETMKKRGLYGKSKIEDIFYQYLCKKFGEHVIERQIFVNKWIIDFYITSIDTYIQFDGVYWHGLDRNINIIKEFKYSKDKIIYNTWLRDQEQNKWFIMNRKSLIRISDQDFIAKCN